jgi:hypothetical protein
LWDRKRPEFCAQRLERYVQSILQSLPQAFQCAGEPHPRGSFADTEHVSDLGVGIAFDLLQDEHDSQAIRQPTHRRL